MRRQEYLLGGEIGVSNTWNAPQKYTQQASKPLVVSMSYTNVPRLTKRTTVLVRSPPSLRVSLMNLSGISYAGIRLSVATPIQLSHLLERILSPGVATLA